MQNEVTKEYVKSGELQSDTCRKGPAVLDGDHVAEEHDPAVLVTDHVARPDLCKASVVNITKNKEHGAHCQVYQNGEKKFRKV